MKTRKGLTWAALIVLALGLLEFLFFSPGAKTAPDSTKTLTPSSSISVTVVVVTNKSKTILPEAFSLSQNYPNPFNPETVIKYSLPEDCQVELTLHNILGQKIKTLVNEYQSAGFKMVRWDGRDKEGNEVASGVYFYKITAGRYVNVKKMAVLK